MTAPPTMDRTGIYGLFGLDGTPVDPRDAAILGMPVPESGASCAALAFDLADRGAVHEDRSGGALTLLLGRLDEPANVAGRLGMAPAASQATLARQALRRFGEDIRHVMAGEWALLHRDGDHLVLASSIAQRDPLLYASKGGRVAVGPDLRQLGRLDWIDDELDDSGLLFALGRQNLRGAMGDRTVLADVRALGAGGFVTFDRRGCAVAPRALPEPAPRWRGGFDDAMAEAEALLTRIVQQRMWSDRIGCMVSGGLDSSTLAWLIARNRRSGDGIHCLTSAAPPESGIVDETDAAAIVADHLGLPMQRIIPAEEPSIYRPLEMRLRADNGPKLIQRHYLYDTFASHALSLQTPLLFDGQFGEFTLTNRRPLASIGRRLRETVRRLRTGQPQWPASDPFHVLLASGRSAALPDAVAAALALPPRNARMPASGEPWGLLGGFEKALAAPASLALGQVRVAQPFRDPRLLTLFSGFTAGMLQRAGQDRAPVRHILRGHLPDSIRLQSKGGAFSPDYFQRLERQALAARDRIGLFRQAGADAWLDLDALDTGLTRTASGELRDGHAVLKVQLTAMTAEFIAWWRGFS